MRVAQSKNETCVHIKGYIRMYNYVCIKNDIIELNCIII